MNTDKIFNFIKNNTLDINRAPFRKLKLGGSIKKYQTSGGPAATTARTAAASNPTTAAQSSANTTNNRSGLTTTQQDNTTATLSMSERRSAVAAKVKEIFIAQGESISATKAELARLKEAGEFPGVKNIPIEAADVRHYAVAHPNKSKAELKAMLNEGLADNEVSIVFSVQLDGDSYADNNYPILLGKAASNTPGTTKNGSYGSYSANNTTGTVEEKNEDEDDVFERTKPLIRDRIFAGWDITSPSLKEHYTTKYPTYAPTTPEEITEAQQRVAELEERKRLYREQQQRNAQTPTNKNGGISFFKNGTSNRFVKKLYK